MQKVGEPISQQQIHYIDYDQLLDVCVLATFSCAHISSLAKETTNVDSVHLSSSTKKVLTPYYKTVAVLIQNCRLESRKYFGKEPDEIFIPYSK